MEHSPLAFAGAGAGRGATVAIVILRAADAEYLVFAIVPGRRYTW